MLHADKRSFDVSNVTMSVPSRCVLDVTDIRAQYSRIWKNSIFGIRVGFFTFQFESLSPERSISHIHMPGKRVKGIAGYPDRQLLTPVCDLLHDIHFSGEPGCLNSFFQRMTLSGPYSRTVPND